MKGLRVKDLHASFILHGHKLICELGVSGATMQLAEEAAWRILNAVTREIDEMKPKQTVAPAQLGLNGHIVSLADAERVVIEHALTFRESKEETARRLGITRPTLRNKIEKHNLQ